MTSSTKFIAPLAAAAAIVGTLALAPLASADTNPLLPYGTNPQPSTSIGQHVSNHDEANTTNGEVDLPF